MVIERISPKVVSRYAALFIFESIKFRGKIYALLNEVGAKRMVKKQQMQWTHEGAHYLLQGTVNLTYPCILFKHEYI